MFALVEHEATLKNLNLRAEKHGDATVTGADLKCVGIFPNAVLSIFDPDLRSFLFTQGEGDLVSDGSFTKLRVPKLSPLKFEDELVGAKVTVDYGVKSAIVLEDCKVNAFVIEPMDTLPPSIGFRVQCRPDEKQIGKLSTLIGGDITVTVEPPEAPADLAGNGS